MKHTSVRSLALLPGLLILFASLAGGGQNRAAIPEPVPWRDARPLPVEDRGLPLSVTWAEKAGLVAHPADGQPIQLIWFKDGKRSEQSSRFASLNLATGRLKIHSPLPGMQVWRTGVSGGRLYLGMNLPSHLLEYDPDTDSLRDLGRALQKGETVYSLAVGPDGAIALGGSTGGTDVALYDPRTRRLTYYGSVGGPQAAYVYTITHDRQYIYCVTRGQGPWELFAIDRNTKEARKLLEVPLKGYLSVGSGVARVTQPPGTGQSGGAAVAYPLRGGRMNPPGSVQPETYPRPQRWKAEAVLDRRDSPNTGKLKVHFRERPEQPWRSVEFPVGREELPVSRLLVWDRETLMGAAGAYGPLFRHRTTPGESTVLGMPEEMNVYTLARLGPHLFMSGYPNAPVARADPERPFTRPETYPGAAGIPWTDPRANPRLLARMGLQLGAHYGLAMTPGADGRLYLCAYRIRYQKGFTIAWIDPSDGRFGEVADSQKLNHFQASWMTTLQGDRLAVSTRVDYDPQKPGAAPSEARIVIIDTRTGRIEGSHVPLPGARALGAFTEVSPGVLVGTAADPAKGDSAPTTVFKYNLRTARLEQTRVYGGVLCGLSSEAELPRKGDGFRKGPDEMIWTTFRIPAARAPRLLVRIDPTDLSVRPVGTLQGGELRFVFLGRDLYVTGAARVRRIRNIVPD